MMPSAPLKLMTAEEMEKVLASATECSEGECSVDEVGDLVGILLTQQKDLNDRIKQIGTMIKSLEVLNEKSDNRDEVRENVRAIMRVFSRPDSHRASRYAGGMATGYSGEVGDGPTDAYKALNPKKYKP